MIVTLGEIMLRLSTEGHRRFVQADSFEACYGGGEANVAISLANFGLKSRYLTKLPDNSLGDSALNSLRRYGVLTDHIARGGSRLGIYFLESGASMRPSRVIYDRAGSAISEAVPADFNFEKIFTDAAWFHISGITPAISPQAAELTEAALKAAKKQGLTVSMDLNFRKKLWTTERAHEVMTKLMSYVDVAIGNEEDYDKVLGINAAGTDVERAALSTSSYRDVLKEALESYGLKYAAVTLRESFSASQNGWSALLYDGSDFYLSQRYDITIVDRVGGGDAFAAGLIYGLIEGKTTRQSLEFAVAASALKHTIPGDFNQVTVTEVENLMTGGGSGRVQR